jgi:hypothetical protein
MLARLDWRTREAKLLTAMRAELTQHLGGRLTAVQAILVERASRLVVYLETMDQRALEAGTMSERDSKQYLAWCGQLRLTLREIGVEAAPAAKGESLADYLTTKAAAR